LLGISARKARDKQPDGSGKASNARPVMGDWELRGIFNRDFDQEKDGDTVRVRFNRNHDVNYFHAYRVASVEPDSRYRITVQARAIGIKGGKVGIIVEDSRGWGSSYYQAKNMDLAGTTAGWVPVSVEYQTLSDAEKIKIVGRRFGGNGVIEGEVQFGSVEIEKIAGGFGPAQAITAITTRDADRDRVFAILINKDLDDAVEVTVRILGGRSYVSTDASVLFGATPFSMNYQAEGNPGVAIREVTAKRSGSNSFVIQLPPVSVTGISFKQERQ
jgi:hypothetical protein